MMPPSNLLPKQAPKEENQSSSNKKAAPTRPQEQPLKCPRCDSSNTKFCYYNNYSLTQPRHFCKTCRRYWTKGGALRNVPIGGGCRKNRKIKSSSRLSCDSKDSSGSSEMGGFKFFHGISPAMDFNLGGLSYSRLNLAPGGIYNQLSSFGDLSATSTAPVGVTSPRFSLDPSGSSDGSVLGFNCPFPSITSGFSGVVQEKGGGSVNANTTLVSSIESLSSINQDLHWKLQQQRLAMLFGGDHQKDTNVSSTPLESQTQKLQPIMFQNLEISKSGAFDAGNSRKGGASGNDIATEWFFGNSYGQVSAAPSNSNGNGNGNATNWNEVQAWGDLHQYNALP